MLDRVNAFLRSNDRQLGSFTRASTDKPRCKSAGPASSPFHPHPLLSVLISRSFATLTHPNRMGHKIQQGVPYAPSRPNRSPLAPASCSDTAHSHTPPAHQRARVYCGLIPLLLIIVAATAAAAAAVLMNMPGPRP